MGSQAMLTFRPEPQATSRSVMRLASAQIASGRITVASAMPFSRSAERGTAADRDTALTGRVLPTPDTAPTGRVLPTQETAPRKRAASLSASPRTGKASLTIWSPELTSWEGVQH